MKPLTLQDYKRRLAPVLTHIQANLDGPLSLEELATLACLSPHHFHRVFSGMLGEGLQGHIRRLRLERAARQLRHSTEPILEIALSAGYDSHEAFTRAFRQAFGCSPAAFRDKDAVPEQLKAYSRIHYTGTNLLPDRFSVARASLSLMNIRIVTLPPQRVATLLHTGPYNEVGKAWDVLCTELGKEGWLGPKSHFLGMGYDDPLVTKPEELRYDACITVPESFKARGEIQVKEIPGGEYAVFTHYGPYSGLQASYSKLMGQWLPRSGREAAGGYCFEEYLNTPENTEPEDLITDIYLPLKGRGSEKREAGRKAREGNGDGMGGGRKKKREARSEERVERQGMGEAILGIQGNITKRDSIMQKLDFLVTHKAEYAAPKKPALVDIGPASYLAIEGVGKPGGALFEAHIGAVYGMAFTVKMSRKAAGLGDYAVCKLECRILSGKDAKELHWQILMRTPDFVTETDLVSARKKLLAKGDNDEVEKVKLVQLAEGQCVQYLHVGPYQNEGVSYDLMSDFAASKGLKPAGAPHEIYISDPRRVEPDKLKTILRLPVAKA